MDLIKKYTLNNIEIAYTKLFLEDENIQEFEKWVYTTKHLEAILEEDDYLNLISLNYKSKYIFIEIDKILKKYIRENIVKAQRLLYVLNKALLYDDDYCEYLGIIYDYYCDGYYFLTDIAILDGLIAKAPAMYDYKYYKNLTDEQKKTLRASLSNGAVNKVQEVIRWLDQGQIILTDKGRPKFIDNRKKN